MLILNPKKKISYEIDFSFLLYIRNDKIITNNSSFNLYFYFDFFFQSSFLKKSAKLFNYSLNVNL